LNYFGQQDLLMVASGDVTIRGNTAKEKSGFVIGPQANYISNRIRASVANCVKGKGKVVPVLN
jgi:hypothetical protein